MRRSDTMKMTSLKSSRSSVHEIMGTKKFDDHAEAVSSIPRSVSMNYIGGNKQRIVAEETIKHRNVIGSSSDVFTFRELAIATENFSSELLVGEGGFGRVYKGFFKKTNQVVAVKQLDRNGVQGNKEFLVEVLTLSLCHHPNLINLKGYCADGQQRILVYEYMHNGSLDRHLHDLPSSKKPLDWYTRMQIAKGAAQGLDYLHYTASPPIIYRDFKTSNILLDERFNPKLSGFGLARFGRMDGSDHAYTRVMVTSGYCAPESQAGELTAKSDIYSFGVVLLEIISGRRAIDNTKPLEEENLVAWAKPLFKDRRKYKEMADPLLEGKYPIKGLYQALAIAAMCLQDEPITRPFIGDIVVALEHLSTPKDEHTSATDEEDGSID